MGCRAWKCWRLVVALSLRTTSASKRCSRQQASKLVRESLVLSMLFHLQHLFARREYAASKFFSADLVPLIPLMYAASFACSSYWKTSVFNAKLNGSWFMLCYPLMLFFWTFAPRTYICTLTGFGNNAHTIPLVVWKFMSCLVEDETGRAVRIVLKCKANPCAIPSSLHLTPCRICARTSSSHLLLSCFNSRWRAIMRQD